MWWPGGSRWSVTSHDVSHRPVARTRPRPTMKEEASMPTVSPERLAEVFVEVADTLVDDFDLIEFLRTVTARAAELVNVAAVGLLLADTHGQLHVMAAS